MSTTPDLKEMTIVFDIEQMRPACVLLQAAYGADSYLAQRFPSRSWLVFPTPGMRMFKINEDQLKQLVEKVETTKNY